MARGSGSRRGVYKVAVPVVVTLAILVLAFALPSSPYVWHRQHVTVAGSYYGNVGMMQYWSSAGEVMKLNASQLASLESTASNAEVSNSTLSFNTSNVRLVVLMGPMSPGQSMYSFVIDNLTNPTLIFRKGANVTMIIVNVDTDATHSLTLTGFGPPYPYNMMYTMMSSQATSIMLNPSSSRVYTSQSIRFTVEGSAYYICTVSGHAQKGMYGRVVVE